MGIGLFISELKKNIILLLSLTVIFGAGLGVEKSFFSSDVLQSTKFHTEATVKYSYANSRYEKENPKYQILFNSYSELKLFLDQSDNKYDYSKFNANWNNLTEIKKIEWLQKHLHMIDMNAGIVQYIFLLDTDEPKDYNYTKQYGKKLLDDYINFSKSRIDTTLAQSNINLISEYTLEPELLVTNKTTVTIKYVLIGAFLGWTVGSIYVLIRMMRTEKDD